MKNRFTFEWQSLTLLLFLFSGASTCLASRSNLRRGSQRHLNAELCKSRVVFQPFSVDLSPTCSNLTETQINQLYISVRNAMTDKFYGKAIQRGNGLSLDYVAISDITAILSNETNCITTVTVGEGVVAWTAPGGNEPNKNEVDGWARAAVQDDLLEFLPAGLSFITTVNVGASGTNVGNSGNNNSGNGSNNNNNNSGNGSGSNNSGGVAGAGDPLEGDPDSSSSDSSKSRMLVMVSIIVAGFCMFALGALFLMKSKNKACVYPYVEENSSSSDSNMGAGGSSKSPDSDEHQDISPVLTATLAVQQHSRSGSSDSHSLASESSWTVNTEAGDSMALKSIAGTAKPANSWPAMATPESFEYDLSKVNVRKDMLTSAWSGRVPSPVDNKNDSVLQPSHFSASQERRRRRLEDDIQLETSSTDTNPSIPSSQKTSSFNIVGWESSSARPNSPGGFVFSSAEQSEDVVIMPPRPKARNSFGHLA